MEFTCPFLTFGQKNVYKPTMINSSPLSLTTQIISATLPEKQISNSVFWFVFQADKLLVNKSTTGKITLCSTPPTEQGLSPTFSRYIGNYQNTDIYVAEIAELISPPETGKFVKLQTLLGKIRRDLFSLAGRAVQIIHWNRDFKFCGRCGTEMRSRKTELAKSCPSCKFISFPRISPAVIMSVVRGKEILLARSPHFAPGMYSTLAGFVEPGETLEETVVREVKEEVNIAIRDINYIASQPWPFPHSLMIGFSTRHASGDIQIDDCEIEDAQWFTRENMPRLPTQTSIARHLIELFMANSG